MTGARALVAALENEGVSVAFGIPGAQVMQIYDALYASSQIRHILVRHEQGAVHAADGYARASGNVGVAFATSGPGATNTVTGIATAYMDSVPVVVITGQVATTSIGTDAFQEADISTITLPIVKHSYLIKDARNLVPAVHEAFYIASTGRPGPVLIDVPNDVANAMVSYTPLTQQPDIASYKPTYEGNGRQVMRAADLIEHADKPVILAGGGVIASGAADELARLSKAASIPVVCTLMAKGALSDTLGAVGMHGLPAANHALNSADLIVAVGTRFTDRVTGEPDKFAPGAKIIHIDIDPAEIGKNIRADVPIVGDAKTVLCELLERLGKDASETPLRHPGVPLRHSDAPLRHPGLDPGSIDCGSRVRLTTSASQPSADTARNDVTVARHPGVPLRHPALDPGSTQTAADAFDDDPESITPKQVFDELNKQLSQYDAIITTDVGQHQMWANQYLRVDGPRRFITSGGLGTMGFGLPAAMGAQVAYPTRLVLCISGDGSLQMTSQEMATIAINKLPVKVLLLNNGALGMVRQWQHLFGNDRFAATSLDDNPDFVKLAEAYRWQAKRTYKQSWLSDDVSWLLSAAGPALLEVPIGASELVLPMRKPNGSLEEMIEHG
jgi:acetolactate synthase-1/2/3 large subunit